ncbi:MAG TPA: hypothetical protein VF699_13335 [Caulobacteraceae bacterium]|jgi:hypothetical protein
MRSESALVEEDDLPPIVQWFAPGAPLRNLPREVGPAVTLAVGVFAVAALAAGTVILIRRALNPELKALKVDKLIVRKITTLENAARYQ